MTGPLQDLPEEALLALASALRSGRLTATPGAVALRHYLHADERERVSRALAAVATAGAGMSTDALAVLLEAIATAKRQARRQVSAPELVWSGPEAGGTASRDTRMVVEELFRTASRSILVAGFAVHDGPRVFGTLARRADTEPALEVALFLNIGRERGDPRPEEQVLFDFRGRFLSAVWPGQRPPRVYYDPRALSAAPGPRAVMHAKCVIADDEHALVTSANLTGAAQERNIEAGVLLHDAVLVRSLRLQFDGLLERGDFRELYPQ